MELIDRQASIELLKIVCDAIMSGCNSHYDSEVGDEVYDDILEVNAILTCNKEIRKALNGMPSAEPEIIRCKDCFYGYLYSGVCNGTTCSWVECKNPDGLNRDVPLDGYCYAAIRRKDYE